LPIASLASQPPSGVPRENARRRADMRIEHRLDRDRPGQIGIADVPARPGRP
jgi:hypothetical protein